MTVIAWDGKTLAADKMATCGDTINTVTKIRRLESGVVVAICGDLDQFSDLARWLEDGEDPEAWPAFQTKDSWATLVVADASGCRHYETRPYPTRYEGEFFAWGSGREAALGAMAMGANAKRAVKIASTYVAGCGRGVDAFRVR